MNVSPQESILDQDLKKQEEAALNRVRRNRDAELIASHLAHALGGHPEVDAILAFHKALLKNEERDFFAAFGGKFQIKLSQLRVAVDGLKEALSGINQRYKMTTAIRDTTDALFAFGVDDVLAERQLDVFGHPAYTADESNVMLVALRQVLMTLTKSAEEGKKSIYPIATEYAKAVRGVHHQVAMRRPEYCAVHLRLGYSRSTQRAHNVWSAAADVAAFVDVLGKESPGVDCAAVVWRLEHQRSVGHFLDCYLLFGGGGEHIDAHISWATGLWSKVAKHSGFNFSLNREPADAVGLLGLGGVNCEDIRQAARLETTLIWAGGWDGHVRLRTAGAPPWGVTKFFR